MRKQPNPLLEPGRASLNNTGRVNPTLLLFSSRPLSFFSISLFSLFLSNLILSHGSDQGHHGQGPCSLTGTSHRRRRSSLTTGGGGFWFGLLPLSLSFSSLLFFFSFLSHSLPHGFHGFPPLSNSRLTLTLTL